jgi:hypothetical protein
MSKNNAQEAFDALYISSSEIQKELKVERSAILYARRRGMLPNPIIVPGVRAFVWEREKVRPYIDAWKLALASRRGELA